MKQLVKTFLTIVSLSFILQGCFFAAGAAAGAATIAVVYDHRTIVKTIKDTTLCNKIAERIRNHPVLHYESHIEVAVFNRVVLLTGETATPALRQQAEDLARSVSGVTRVYNQITLEGPTSTLTRTSDSWITAKIKTQMLATENLRSGSIKVLTENGVVYLMGIASRQQVDIAVDIARQGSGVQKVVKVFQYTD